MRPAAAELVERTRWPRLRIHALPCRSNHGEFSTMPAQRPGWRMSAHSGVTRPPVEWRGQHDVVVAVAGR